MASKLGSNLLLLLLTACMPLVRCMNNNIPVVTDTDGRNKLTSSHNSYTQPEKCCCLIKSGPPGPSGLDGRDGREGRRGEPGPVGPKGELGSAGQRGEKGNKGRRGRQGSPGKAGPKGESGSKGPRGFTGERGPPGRPAKPPSKVAFFVKVKEKAIGNDDVLHFEDVVTNVGDHFDVGRSRFISPEDGIYVFHVHLLADLGKKAQGFLYKGRQVILPLHAAHSSQYGSDSNTAVLMLRKGEEVYIQLKKNSAVKNDYSTFSGYMLHRHRDWDTYF